MSNVETKQSSKGTKNTAANKANDDPRGLPEEVRNIANEIEEKKRNKSIASIVSIIGVLFIIFPLGSMVIPFFSNIWPSFIGVALLAGAYAYYSPIYNGANKTENSFVGVDYKYSSVSSVEKYIDEKISLRFSEINQPKSDEVDMDSLKGKGVDYAGHSLRLLAVLQAKADAADEKASILLQRGVAYTKFGIAYYLVSIIIWQFIFFHNGYKKEYLWGIASCSFLFLFIEFLSAWFLKQYKNFTDNSVYLLKVKSIFDRYLLIYHLENNKDGGGNEKHEFTIAALSKDIMWPDVSVIESKEDTFSKEAVTSITEAIKSIKKAPK
ncbi:hypothetical protein CIP106467_2806 [Citrobacter europaeus]|uniref:hypothetical protein n=1 Tax=Citrobacter europaeus TaxID=1914243 RepID=UPI000883C250|nr:hypothetical protein [Citrobacter europaeus]UBI17882.1 hypothetical protein LA337_09415 [Citrobacter europaeus]CAD7562702.1 hypothetical protein CIP106467_2806 [Citrobacter europaeus]